MTLGNAVLEGLNDWQPKGGRQVLVVNALGRVFMPPIDDPFRAPCCLKNK